MKPSISIVIPTYQRCASVMRALHLLETQTLAPFRFEVIVVLDGSTDGTLEMLGSYHPRYRTCALWQANRGRAAACNAGIDMASGDVIVLLDDDMQPEPEFLEAHLDAHAGQPKLAVIGAAPIDIPGDASPTLRFVAEKFNTHITRLSA